MKARRLPVIDEFVDGDQLAVFANGQLTVLSTVASTALLAAGEEWTHLHVIAGAVIEAVGPPPEGSAEDAVVEILAALAELHLIEVSA